MNPLDWVRAHAVALGLDPEGMAIAAQAQIDQAQAWQRQANPDTACPDECACHAYMQPGRVCSWCQQEGHEDR